MKPEVIFCKTEHQKEFANLCGNKVVSIIPEGWIGDFDCPEFIHAHMSAVEFYAWRDFLTEKIKEKYPFVKDVEFVKNLETRSYDLKCNSITVYSEDNGWVDIDEVKFNTHCEEIKNRTEFTERDFREVFLFLYSYSKGDAIDYPIQSKNKAVIQMIDYIKSIFPDAKDLLTESLKDFQNNIPNK